MAKKSAESCNSMGIITRTEDNLSETDKIFRDRFIMEYIKDFRGDLAMHRCGYTNIKTARTTASRLLREPYVARKLDETIRTLQPFDIVSRQQVMAKLWAESNDPSNMDGVRVAACAHVAKMLGMFLHKEDADGQAPIGVMLIPCTTPEDWATAAPLAQAVLKSRAAMHDAA